MIGGMSTAPARERLGQLVKTRRLSLGMSLTAAAKAADIHRNTWTGVERAETETEDYNYAKIERALGWEIGSSRAVLNGGDPSLAEPNEPAASDEPAQDVLIAIAQDSTYPDYIRKMALTTLDQVANVRDAAAASKRYGHLRSLDGDAS